MKWKRRMAKFSICLVVGVLLFLVPMALVQAALDTPTVVGERIEVAENALVEQAQREYQSGRYDQARVAWEAAYAEFERVGDHAGQIATLNSLASTYQQLGNWQLAQVSIQNSFELLSALDSNHLQRNALYAQTLNAQAALKLVTGQVEEAHDLWLEAERYYQNIEDWEGQLGTQLNQIHALQSMGLYRQASLQLAEIESQVVALQDSSLKGSALKSLGDVFQITGDLKRAQEALQKSIQIAERVNDSGLMSSALLSLGNAYRRLSVDDLAIDAYGEAAQMATNPLTEATAALNELALLIRVERWDAIEIRVSTAVSLTKSLEPSRAGIYAQVNLATSLQKLLQASVRFEEVSVSLDTNAIAEILSIAIGNAKAINDQRAEAYALGQLGALYEQTQQLDHALELTSQALRLSQRLNADEITYRWQWQQGRLLKMQAAVTSGPLKEELATAAISAYHDAVNTLQLIRADLVAANTAVQFSFRDSVEPVYREWVDLLTTLDPNEQNLQLARQAIEDLQLAELQNFFRSACLDIQAQQIDQIDPTAAVIYPVILPERLLVITSIPGSPLQQYTIPIAQSELEKTVSTFLQSLNPVFSNSARLEVSNTIYQWLVAPLETKFRERQINTLVFALDTSLRNIPMAALHNGERYLVEEFNVALTPGLQLLPPKRSLQDSRDILAGGITESRQGFPALPGVANEIEQISNIFPTTVFLDEGFTLNNLQKEINVKNFPVVHLATHGQFSSDLDNTFLLGWEKTLKIQDFQVLIREQLPQVDRPIELLVLSACQTAEGDREAVLGLAGLAVRSGARSTLATLWSVNDQSTAQLISEFYKQLSQPGNGSKAQALRRSQLQLLKSQNYSHPFYWASFVLVGNWL